MERLIVRAATVADIPGIRHVNRGEAGPWAEMESCASWVENRLKNGFYIQIAELDGCVVGHGEWLAGEEYRWKTSYLGQLQVDPDFQFRGVGRWMLADGIRQARLRGCESVSLIPETDTNSQIFYEKCGLARGKDILQCSLPSEKGEVRGKNLPEAPRSAALEFPFLFGLTQTSASHMWQVFNRRPANEGRMVDTLAGDGYCLQLGGFSRERNALLVAWGAREAAPEIVWAARVFAHALGYPGVDFFFFPEMKGCFSEGDVQPHGYEMYLDL